MILSVALKLPCRTLEDPCKEPCLRSPTLRVHVPQIDLKVVPYLGTLGPKCILFGYMDP